MGIAAIGPRGATPKLAGPRTQNATRKCNCLLLTNKKLSLGTKKLSGRTKKLSGNFHNCLGNFFFHNASHENHMSGAYSSKLSGRTKKLSGNFQNCLERFFSTMFHTKTTFRELTYQKFAAQQKNCLTRQKNCLGIFKIV